MISKPTKITFVILTVIAIVFVFAYCNAAELKLSDYDNSSRNKFYLTLDKVTKLAGMKLSLTYPSQLLLFKQLNKTPTTKNFLHVVNDKNPGKLIIVMASAKGVSGKNLDLFEIEFSAIPTSSELRDKNFQIDSTECELMSEDLKEIPCTFLPYHILSQSL